MYDDTVTMIGGIIGLIMIITFFVMASRLGTLSRYLKQIRDRNIHEPFYEAQIEEVNGNTSKAIEKYIVVLYFVTFAEYTIGHRGLGGTSMFIKEKIETLGGSVPDSIREKNPFF